MRRFVSRWSRQPESWLLASAGVLALGLWVSAAASGSIAKPSLGVPARARAELLVSTRLLPRLFGLRLAGLHNGAAVGIRLPSAGIPRGARVRAVVVQASVSGPAIVVFGGPGSSVTIGSVSAARSQVSVGGGIVPVSGSLAVRVSGQPAEINAFVVGLLIQGGRRVKSYVVV